MQTVRWRNSFHMAVEYSVSLLAEASTTVGSHLFISKGFDTLAIDADEGDWRLALL